MQTEEQVRAGVRAVPGERYVYEVPSDRNARIYYRVDLTANDGAGECSCRDWATRRYPALKKGAPPLTQASCCKHQRRALWFFLRDLMPALAKQEQTPKNKSVG